MFSSLTYYFQNTYLFKNVMLTGMKVIDNFMDFNIFNKSFDVIYSLY